MGSIKNHTIREYFELIENTLKNPTYTNLKKFIKGRLNRLRYIQSINN